MYDYNYELLYLELSVSIPRSIYESSQKGLVTNSTLQHAGLHIYFFLCTITLEKLFNTMKRIPLPSSWFLVNSSDRSVIVLSHLTMLNSSPQIKFTVTINTNLTCSLGILGKTTLPNYATIYSLDHFSSVLKDLSEREVCSGNSDSTFVNLISQKGGVLMDKKG